MKYKGVARKGASVHYEQVDENGEVIFSDEIDIPPGTFDRADYVSDEYRVTFKKVIWVGLPDGSRSHTMRAERQFTSSAVAKPRRPLDPVEKQMRAMSAQIRRLAAENARQAAQRDAERLRVSDPTPELNTRSPIGNDDPVIENSGQEHDEQA